MRIHGKNENVFYTSLFREDKLDFFLALVFFLADDIVQQMLHLGLILVKTLTALILSIPLFSKQSSCCIGHLLSGDWCFSRLITISSLILRLKFFTATPIFNPFYRFFLASLPLILNLHARTVQTLYKSNYSACLSKKHYMW